MKKNIRQNKVVVIAVCVAILAGSFAGCKKNISPTASSNETIQKINSWLNAQKMGMQKFKSDNIELLKENLDFINLNVEELPDGNRIIVVPITDNFKQQKVNDKTNIINLVILANSSGEITNGNVVLFKPDSYGQYSKVPVNTFHDIYTRTKVRANGVFQFLTPAGQRQYELSYKNNELESFKKLKVKQPESAAKTKTICIDWYWVTTFYYSDGSTVTTSEYLGTTCGDGCGDGSYASLCPDSFSEGVGNEIATGATVIESDSYAPIMTAGSAVTDPNTGRITRTVSLEWQCGHGSTILFGSFFNWIYRSHETGVEYLDNGHWKFESLTHNSIQRIGTTPPLYNYTLGLINAYSSIAGNASTATMTLTYVVYETIQSGLPFPQTKSWQLSAGANFQAE